MRLLRLGPIKLQDASEALVFYRQISTVKPVREDGRPNKPLTAYTIEIVNYGP